MPDLRQLKYGGFEGANGVGVAAFQGDLQS
jgi:hypothetical protein